MRTGFTAGSLSITRRVSRCSRRCFAAGIARQALLTGLGAAPRYEEHAAPYYLAAARAALAAAEADDSCGALAHIDNDAAAAIRLLADMLAKREQWIEGVEHATQRSFVPCWRRRWPRKWKASSPGSGALPPTLVAALADHERYAAENLTVTRIRLRCRRRSPTRCRGWNRLRRCPSRNGGLRSPIGCS